MMGTVKDATKSGRPVSATCNTIVSKVREIENDGRSTICDIAVGISLLRVQFILTRILKVGKISAR